MKQILLISAALMLSVATSAQQPLTLQQCRDLALQHNEDLKHADNALLQAEMDKQIAFANYLPQLDGSLMGIYGKDIDMMGMSTIQMHGMWMAGLTLTQPLYTDDLEFFHICDNGETLLWGDQDGKKELVCTPLGVYTCSLVP